MARGGRRKRAWYGGAGINTQINKRKRAREYAAAPKCNWCGCRARYRTDFGLRCGRHTTKRTYP